MSPNSRRPSVRRPFLFRFLLLALLLAGTASLTAPPPRAAAAFISPGSSTASKAFIPATVPVVAGSPVPHAPKTDLATHARLQESYGKLPLSFEANRGQMDSEVKFLSRGNGYSLFLTSTEAVLALRKQEVVGRKNAVNVINSSLAPRPSSSSTLRMKLLGANPTARMTGLDELPGKANYFIGKDPDKWRTHVPTYSKVKREAVYPGVDLVYYGNQQQLEYDFVVAPGADTRVIQLAFGGARKMRVDARGDLVLRSGGRDVRWQKPVIYQEIDGVRREVAGGYQVKALRQVGFRVAAYDRSRPLIIDPVLVYSTYLGGSGIEEGRDIAVDATGNAYVTGQTSSTNFPTANALQPAHGSDVWDAFVAKLDPTGSALVYSTYLGGNHFDSGEGIAVDATGNACVTGLTGSTNFPTTNALQPTKASPETAGLDAFVARLDPSGSALIYSTYLGGTKNDGGAAIAVNATGAAHVTGATASTDFPIANALQPVYGGDTDAFVAKLTPTGSSLVYSTFLGGSEGDQAYGIAVDTSDHAYVTGRTQSSNFPTVNPLQPTFGGGSFINADGFVAKLSPSGNALVYSTFLGGNEFDEGWGIAADASGHAYVAGRTQSTNFPTTNALQSSYGGGFFDAFVAKFDPTGSLLLYSSYLGGSGRDDGFDIAADSSGSPYLTGSTGSTNFPISNALQSAFGGGNSDAFVTKLNASGSALVYSTYLGGSGDEGPGTSGIAVDPSGSAYLVGRTDSNNFPIANALQSTKGGNTDAFVAKIAIELVDTTAPTVSCPAGSTTSANANCQAAVPAVGATATDNSPGAVTVTQSPAAGTMVGPGTYTITVTATDAAGNSSQCTTTFTVVDTTTPEASCIATTNPSGNNLPNAGNNPKSGQNPDGFYQLFGKDNCTTTASVQIFVKDSASSFVAGPYAPGTKVKITQAPGVTPNEKKMAGEIAAHIHLKGDALIYAVDALGNQSAPHACLVPPPPK